MEELSNLDKTAIRHGVRDLLVDAYDSLAFGDAFDAWPTVADRAEVVVEIAHLKAAFFLLGGDEEDVDGLGAIAHARYSDV